MTLLSIFSIHFTDWDEYKSENFSKIFPGNLKREESRIAPVSLTAVPQGIWQLVNQPTCWFPGSRSSVTYAETCQEIMSLGKHGAQMFSESPQLSKKLLKLSFLLSPHVDLKSPKIKFFCISKGALEYFSEELFDIYTVM